MKPNIVFLDAASVDYNDIDLAALKKIGSFQSFNHTNPSQVLKRIQNAHIVISNKVVLGQREVQAAQNLKLICVAATGTNNIDIKACQQLKIAVSNARNYSTTSVVEQTIMFLLATSHRLLEQNDSAFLNWPSSPFFTVTQHPYQNLSGKVLGLIGYGTIGKKVAQSAKSLGLKVKIAKIPGRQYKGSVQRYPLEKILKHSDYISLHCPLSDLTKELINSKSLLKIKPTATLINLARGPVVNEKAVSLALRKNKLAFYATDVLEQEPPSKNNPLFLKSIRHKVLITPHVAWASQESRQNLINEITKNIQSFKKGKIRNKII